MGGGVGLGVGGAVGAGGVGAGGGAGLGVGEGVVGVGAGVGLLGSRGGSWGPGAFPWDKLMLGLLRPCSEPRLPDFVAAEADFTGGTEARNSERRLVDCWL